MNELTDSLAALGAGETDSETVDSRKPLAIDLFCGLGGWTEALLAEGWRVIGFDIERHDYGNGSYPGQLVLQDVRTIHGAQFKDADLIVASPPCQFFSRMAMPFRCPWKQEEFERRRKLALELFWSCWRIRHEANEAASHDGCLKCGIFHPATMLNGCEFTPKNVPLIVENVVGTQKWVGQSRFAFRSFHLWGDIPALMPFPAGGQKNTGGSWFGQRDGELLDRNDPRDVRRDENGDFANAEPRGGWNHPNNRMVPDGTKMGGGWWNDSTNNLIRKASSRSQARKAASAQIAKIPFPLAQHIAKVFKPTPGPSPAKTSE